MWRSLACSVLALAALCGGASAAPGKCFFANQFESWRAADDRTVYIRVNLHDYYRLDLASRCPVLLNPGSYLVTRFHGSDNICSAVDWDLMVADNSGMKTGCIVKTMTPLSDADARAIPKKFKP